MGVPVRKTVPPVGFALREIAALHEQVERALTALAGRHAGDARHLRREEQALEVVRLVDDQHVDAEFLERERVVLALLVGRVRSFAARFSFAFSSSFTLGSFFPASSRARFELHLEVVEFVLQVVVERVVADPIRP
jgi:hypothetical protein